jgi:hypothetical protein
MTTKSNKVDWGGLTLQVKDIEYDVAGPGQSGTNSGRAPNDAIVAATTAYTVLAADSGKVFMIPDVTGNCTATLPAAAAGLTFEFWYVGIATDAQNFLVVTQSGEYFSGGVLFANTSAAATTPVYGDGTSDDTFTVVTPAAGTWFKFVSDGTTWYMTGQVVSATVCTIA